MVKKDLKILVVTPHWEPAFEMGGIVKSLSLFSTILPKLGADITVFTTNNNGLGKLLNVPTNKKVNVNDVKVWYFPTKLFNNKFFFSPQLGKSCYERMSEFDLLHVVSFWCYPAIPACRAASRNNIPYVIGAHGALMPQPLKMKWIRKKIFMTLFEKRHLEEASAIYYSTEIERESSEKSNKLKIPSCIVPNPLEPDAGVNLPNRKEARDFFSLPDDTYVISFVGRLNRHKCLDILIRSFAKLLSKLNDNCFLLLAGPDDGDKNRLERLVKKHKLNHRVKFIGFADKQRREFVLKASDLFWLASKSENFGYAAVEAMAAGVPVILSETVGICTDVIKERAGIIVSHNCDEIATKIIGLFLDKERIREMSGNAKNLVLKYDLKKATSLMLLMFEDVLTGHRSPECNWKA